MKEMIHTDSNQSEWSITEHSSLLGRRSLVLSHLCHPNKQRTSTVCTLEKPTLVFVQLGQWRDVLHLRNTITRNWQLQWSHSGKSPKWVQRHPHLHRIPYQLWEWRGRPNRWTNLKISNQPIYNSSNVTLCPLSLWIIQYQHVNCHSHYNSNTIQYHDGRSRSVRRRTSRRWRWTPRRRRRCTRGWQPRRRWQCPTNCPARWKTYGCTTNNLWRRSLKSWELPSRILHLPPS